MSVKVVENLCDRQLAGPAVLIGGRACDQVHYWSDGPALAWGHAQLQEKAVRRTGRDAKPEKESEVTDEES